MLLYSFLIFNSYILLNQCNTNMEKSTDDNIDDNFEENFNKKRENKSGVTSITDYDDITENNLDTFEDPVIHLDSTEIYEDNNVIEIITKKKSKII